MIQHVAMTQAVHARARENDKIQSLVDGLEKDVSLVEGLEHTVPCN